MFSTVTSMAFEQNSSFYTTSVGSSTLDGFSISVPEAENTTSLPYMLPPYIRTTSMVVCIVVMVLGIIGNLMVPLVVLRGKDMRNSTNIFLVNLSVADLCVLLICTPTVLVEVNSGPHVWPLGEHMCKAVPFVELTVAHASVLTILAISFERYYAICEPLRAGYVCTKARATCLCLLAWITAAVCTSPMIWIPQYREMPVNGADSSLYGNKSQQDSRLIPFCITQADTDATAAFFLILVVLFFFVPLLILMVLYSIIVMHLMKDTSSTTNTSELYHSRARRQVILMLLTVVFSFFVCLAPFKILTFYLVLAPDKQVQAIDKEVFNNILYFSRNMFYLNSAINPILYNLMSSRFRLGFLRLLGIKRRLSVERGTLKSTVTDTRLSRRALNNDQQVNFV